MLIYLDYNIILDLFNGRKPISEAAITEAKIQKRAIFPYSPAHIEEVYVAERSGGTRTDSVRKLRYISGLSDNIEIVPSSSGPIQFISEDPEARFEIAISDRNDEAEKISQKYLEEAAAFGVAIGEVFDPKIINNLTPNNFWDHPQVDIALNKYITTRIRMPYIESTESEYIKSLKINHIKHDRVQMAIFFEIMFDFLDIVNFRREKKSRSKMHDVSHAIYGTKADIFITQDKAFFRRCSLVYGLLSVETDVRYVDRQIDSINIDRR